MARVRGSCASIRRPDNRSLSPDTRSRTARTHRSRTATACASETLDPRQTVASARRPEASWAAAPFWAMPVEEAAVAGDGSRRLAAGHAPAAVRSAITRRWPPGSDASLLRVYTFGTLFESDSCAGLQSDFTLRRHVLFEGKGDEGALLGAHEHTLAGGHRVAVAAPEDEVGDRDCIHPIRLQRLAVDAHVADPVAG